MSKITTASIRLPQSLKEQADEKAKERGFERMSGQANFSAYIRWLIENDV